MSARQDERVRLIGQGSPKRDQDIGAHVWATMVALEMGCLPAHGLGTTLDVLLNAYLNLGVKYGEDAEALRQPIETLLENLEEAVGKAQLVHAEAGNSRGRPS